MTTATTAPAIKQVAINDIGSAEDFLAAVEKTLKFFNDGDLIDLLLDWAPDEATRNRILADNPARLFRLI